MVHLVISRLVFFISSLNNHLGYIKQIAGRAGRLSSEYEYGEVTAWQEMDLAYVRSVMKYDVPPIQSAGIFPSVEQIDLFSRELMKQQDLEREGMEGEREAVLKVENDDDEDEVDVLVGVAAVEGEPRAIANTKENNEDAAAIETGASLVSHTRLSLLLKKFVETSQTSGDYFLCEHSDLVRISNWLNSIPLTLTDR